ncbi:IMS domain-containing protein [Chamaesiphon sp. OTE_8_metabat_110]|uniref:IMS domain-containing protein n=1 Tax=Chamaesiphon sp. OTE_8_metabat_110 TaxID=2964696 RepID=UPI00286B7735|nr:IMS domain-containing protein [Chamaesiphon sp. OTE_8_metabat_110]
MRIPLDYYQILGVPESDLSGLEQAYQDRLLQLPQQEYSDAAIESRNRLITVAYQVLSDPIQRAEYAATQAASALVGVESTATNAEVSASQFYRRPELDIATEHFVGGLLILFELGQYEEINSICMPHLGNNGRSNNSGSLHPQQPPTVTPSGNVWPTTKFDAVPIAKVKHTASGSSIVPLKPDILLAMVSSFWELGEREWRDGCYEEATIHYETAKKILVREDLFPQIQGEVDRKLDRLRPYRISSLVSLSLDRHEQRRQGIQFLEELLESACTNEVKCQERFALNSESTIAFIHETLPYLTAAEQRNLFSQLARDSQQAGTRILNVMQLACTYLHVHALIVQGFAYRNPQLIYTAQQILQYRLSQRIDCSIEQSICALLLGQTEEANQILASAAESSALVVIRQQSQGLPNLLRGLCWYIESWLKDEAFPCFRDLVASDPALNAYFNDRDVQDFADRVPATDKNITSWGQISPILIEVPQSGELSLGEHLTESPLAYSASASADLTHSNVRRPNSLNAAWQPPADRIGGDSVDPAIRVEPVAPPEPPPPIIAEPDPSNVIQLENERQRRRSSQPTARTIDGQFEQAEIEDRRPLPLPLPPDPSSQIVTAAKTGQLTERSSLHRQRRIQRKPNIPRILLVGTGGVTCAWGAIWLATTAIGVVTKPQPPKVAIVASPSPRTAVSPISRAGLATTTPQPVNAAVLTPEIAQAVVTKWLAAKSQSLSQSPQVDRLKSILVEPALSSAIDRAQTAKAEGVHWLYQHQNIGIVSISQPNPASKTATIQARVTEDARYYRGNRLDPARSYSKPLLVEYNVVRQKDGWYIKGMGVVK